MPGARPPLAVLRAEGVPVGGNARPSKPSCFTGIAWACSTAGSLDRDASWSASLERIARPGSATRLGRGRERCGSVVGPTPSCYGRGVRGHLILVPTPIGNLGDLTERAKEALAEADLVACEDTRRTGGLLKHLGIEKPLLRFDDHAGEEAYARVAAELSSGRTLAYCSDAGMPGINDPGFEIARAARAAGAEVTVLPGASAVTLAVVASGLPCHAFSFLGYLPSRSEPRRGFLKAIGGREETTVVFETPHRIHETLSELAELLPDREIALGRELTKLHESWYRGTPSEIMTLLGNEGRGEMVLVIAGAAAKRVVSEAGADFAGELPEWALRYLDAAREGGLTLREAVKPLAKHLGVSASDLYKLAAER
ncbi:MAG: 16S rRNA (cytidine(1402)-2'-O)-methyltransferase [Acidobacteria bacterium]|nr:16S rRNA (cytidine(1402)-2'-O)-methyltransferase [Acidobacteriota bacterium]